MNDAKERYENHMEHAIKISRGEVIGIGKVKIPRTQDFDYEIQMLTFIVIKETGNSFISTCIHLHIDGYGKTANEANKDMVENIYYFLRKNFEKLSLNDAWDNLEDLFKSDKWSNELWDAYHAVQIKLSIQGRSTDNIDNLQKRIDHLLKRVKMLESKEALKLEKEIMEVMEESIVDYTPVEAAA
jgi:polyhydroxyalkanoate synthesis regulator phasin